MMKTIFLTIFLGCTMLCKSQQSIRIDEAGKHVGDSVQLAGTVSEVRYFPNGKGAPTLINLDGKYPDQKLTLVIYGESRAKFKADPEKDYSDHKVKVYGRISEFKGRPQIVLYDENQILKAD